MLFFFILGDIIGGGIYALVGEVGADVGGAIWASFLAALFLAALTAGSYAELVTEYPRAGGAALYAMKAFRSPLVAFLVAFAVMASGVTSASALSRAFGGDYLAEFIDINVVVAAVVFVLVVAVINLHRDPALGAAECRLHRGRARRPVPRRPDWSRGPARRDRGSGPCSGVQGGNGAALAVLAGASVAFYSLIGFEDSVNIAEEAEQPRRSYPVALFGGLAAAGLIYLLVTVVASMAVPTHQLATSSGALLEVVQISPLAVPTKVFSAIGLLALANGALINMIMASRLLYGMATEGVLLSYFARLSPRATPIVAIVFTTLIAVGLIATGDLGALADTTVLLLLLVFIAVNVSVLILRRDPVAQEHFPVPFSYPFSESPVAAGHESGRA